MDPGHWSGRLAGLAERTGVPGAVLGVWADGQATVVPHGVLNVRTGQPTAADSVFQIGSITKAWTATMIAQLVAEGRTSYDAPVTDILPRARLGRVDASDRITLRHLVTHSSGLDREVFEDTGRGDDCVDRFVGLLADAERLFEPGAAHSYCNSGFVVLGRVIEVLDGCTWDESLRRRLVSPLGLTETVTLPEEAILRSAAIGHHGAPGAVTPYATWMLPRSIGPSGLITVSAGDLLSFARLHVARGLTPAGDRLLPERAVTEMWAEEFPLPDRHQYSGFGMSWRVGCWSGADVLAHDGGTVGQSARIRVAPGRDFAVCVLTNSSNGKWLADVLLYEVFRDVAGIEIPPNPLPDAEADPGDLTRHVGRYERRGMTFDVAVEDNRLMIRVTRAFDLAVAEPEAIPMVPADSSGNCFVGRTDPAKPWWSVAFAMLPDGRPQLFAAGRLAPRVG